MNSSAIHSSATSAPVPIITTTITTESSPSPSPSERGWSIAGASDTTSTADSPITLTDAMDFHSSIGSGPLPTLQQSYQVSSMPEVRAAIDHLDRVIVTLLGTRMRFIEAAARIKPARGAVRDQWRVDDVITKCKKTAEGVDFPPEVVEKVYAVLVEESIRHEYRNWDRIRGVTDVPAGEEKY